MALKKEKVSQEKAEQNKATLKELREWPGFAERMQEGYVQIERGEIRYRHIERPKEQVSY